MRHLTEMGHEPVVRGDTVECKRCGKQWDINDPEPPPCKQPKDYIEELRGQLRTKRP